MKQITIVGLGPGSAAYLTMEAYDILINAPTVYLRTEKHPIVETLVDKGMIYKSFDDLYESEETFDAVYERIVEAILELAEHQDVVYAVPGNPFVAERTVSILLDHLEKENASYKIVHGTSFLDAIITTLQYDPVNGLSISDALSIDRERIDTHHDSLWIQVYDKGIASQLKLKLMDYFEDTHEVRIIRAAGIPEMETILTVPIWEMDHHAVVYDHLTSVFVPRSTQASYDLEDLITIMRQLRSDEGCPWDREQTHESLTPYLVEEAYEVKHAVFYEDDDAVVDELGDVLLQVVFHTTIAEEEGYYSIRDVIRAVCEKMIRRHPHVFGDVKVQDSQEVLKNWQVIKADEKAQKSVVETMRGVSSSLPALIRSPKVQKKASELGFDWPDLDGIFDKIDEEIAELREAIASNDASHIYEEFGDLLLILTNLARRLKLDAELALNDAVDKFIGRFEVVENEMRRINKPLGPEFISDMAFFWEKSKNTAE